MLSSIFSTPKSRRRFRCLFALLLLIPAAAAWSRTGDLVIDGDFPAALTSPADGGWTLLPGSELSTRDRGGQATSRSLRAASPDSFGRNVAEQCISLSGFLAPIRYQLEAWMRVEKGSVSIELYSFDGDACTGSAVSLEFESDHQPVWSHARVVGALPASAKSVGVSVYTFGFDGAESLGYVDDVSLFLGETKELGFVQNRSLDFGDVSAWQFTNEGFWSDGDAEGGAYSGSISPFDGRTGKAASQCLFLEQGFDQRRHHSLVADARVYQGEGWVVASYYSSKDCSGTPLNNLRLDIEPNQAWTRYSDASFPPGGFNSIEVSVWGFSGPQGQSPYFEVDNIDLIPRICVAGDGYLCLLSDRYRVRMTYELNGETHPAHAVQLTSDSGYFQFFGPANIEASIKMVDGCSVNGNAWVYIGGMTDLAAKIEVFDFGSGEEYVVTSAGGVPFPGVADVNAVPACEPTTTNWP